jgi:hypothetical protein
MRLFHELCIAILHEALLYLFSHKFMVVNHSTLELKYDYGHPFL